MGTRSDERRCHQRADGDARRAPIFPTGCHSNPLAFVTQVYIGGSGVVAITHRHSYQGFVVRHYVRRVTFRGSVTRLACAVSRRRMMGNMYMYVLMYTLISQQLTEDSCCCAKVIFDWFLHQPWQMEMLDKITSWLELIYFHKFIQFLSGWYFN